jgi:DNA-3-methyladenine glycosylase
MKCAEYRADVKRAELGPEGTQVSTVRGIHPRRLRRSDLPTDTVELARFLIGKTVVHDLPEGRSSGRIVEVEAYPPGDEAGHAYTGWTPSRASLFLRPGHAYIYISHGTWRMLNVSAGPEGEGAGVLIRAIEPLEGTESMESRRGTRRLLDLTRGPGRLAMAMAITLDHDGVDLCGRGRLWLGTALRDPGTIDARTRIGLTRAVDRRLRFFERGNPFVSGPRHLLDVGGGRRAPASS